MEEKFFEGRFGSRCELEERKATWIVQEDVMKRLVFSTIVILGLAGMGSCSDGKDAVCGNDIAEEGEICDGADLRGETCETQGFDGGTLGCLEDCSGFDTSGCWMDYSEIIWIDIPEGSFEMGSEKGFSNELPLHTVDVPGFEMTKTQVTVAQYNECVTSGECTQPSTEDTRCNWVDKDAKANHPVNCVTWFQAVDFCSWAGGRLPSESEWEYAARSGGRNVMYPWGDQPATCELAVMNDGGNGCGTGRTWPVCSKEEGNTSQDLCDMAGNVWEWVQDWYHDDYENAPDDGSAWEDPAGSFRVLRGGGFGYKAYNQRAAVRHYGDPPYVSNAHGFRCAR